MDPLLLFVLELVIIAAMLYLYLWLRAVSRRVEDRELDAKLDDLEESVTETTHWLERASAEIREDIEERTERLQKLLAQAEELLASVRRRDAARTAHEEPAASPNAEGSESAAQDPESTGTRPPAGSAQSFRGSGDEPRAMSGQPSAPESPARASDLDVNAVESSEESAVRVWRPPQLEDEVSALIDAAVAGGDRAVEEPVAEPAEPVSEPENSDPGPLESPQQDPPDPAERRQRIIELAADGLSPVEIAERLGASRAEVELVVAMHRRRR